MARRFTAASSDRVSSSTALDLAGFNWLFGTMALLISRATATANAEQLVCTNDSAGTFNQYYIEGGNNKMTLWDTGSSDFIGAVPENVPMLLGWSKPTGTVTPRGHKYQFDTNTWTHNDGSATQANSGAMTSIVFGSSKNGSGNQQLNAEVWAIGLWQRSMTDSEFQRLAAGNWLNTAPDFYEQWTDGREVTAMKSTLGKYPVRQTSMTGTTRGVQKPPPGFRMCVQRRRR